MKNACVIGSPIAHSLSPAIYSYLAFLSSKDQFLYSAVEVLDVRLASFLQEARKSLVALNVTLPLKEKVIPYLEKKSDEVLATGACNFIKNNDGRFEGYNTDVIGILESLRQNHFDAQKKTVLILGAGGAARSAAFALAKAGASAIVIYSRRADGAQTIADQIKKFFDVNIQALNKLGREKFSLIINATPLGMEGFESETDPKVYFSEVLALSADENSFSFDLIYKPSDTEFLKISKARGLKTLGGLDMLINQALKNWELLFETEPVDLKWASNLKKYLEVKLNVGKKNIIFICGFMGAGKSSVSRELANLLNWRLIDTDQMIEKKTQMTVSEYFETSGEKKFRNLESEMISSIAGEKKTVVSLGGGALLDCENLKCVINSGVLVYLQADASVLALRLKNSKNKRPLLKLHAGADLDEKIKGMLENRESHYRLAHFQVVTENLSVIDVAKTIASLLKVAP
jgi:shikimate dehydrogenase